MGTVDRAMARGTRLGIASLRLLGEDVRRSRMESGVSQAALGRKVRMSASKVCRIEAGTLVSLTVMDAGRIASAAGLDLVVRTYPGPRRPRDSAHARRLAEFLRNVGPPLRWRTEVPVQPTGEYPDQRAWDAVLVGHAATTAIELEMRLYDVQAQLRRLSLKQRDGSTDHLLLVVADTRGNRMTLREYPELFLALPRLRTRQVLEQLQPGIHPTTGVVVF